MLVPVADFFSCFVQRLAKRISPFTAGREHFHHALLRAGLSKAQVVATLVGIAALYAGVGLLGAATGVPDWAMFSLWMTLLASQYWIVNGFARLARRLSASPRTAEYGGSGSMHEYRDKLE